MSIGFFIFGAIIFAVYLYLTLWNIAYSSKKQRQENYPNLGGEGADEPTRMDPIDKKLEDMFLK
jgi:hypothetical protein